MPSDAAVVKKNDGGVTNFQRRYAFRSRRAFTLSRRALSWMKPEASRWS